MGIIERLYMRGRTPEQIEAMKRNISEDLERERAKREALASMPAIDCPFGHKERLKRAFSSAKWDPCARTWRVSAEQHEAACKFLEDL